MSDQPSTPTEPIKGSERERMRAVLEAFAQTSWDGGDIDGGDFQDVMTKHGLLVEMPADKAFKEEWDADTMLVLSWKVGEVTYD